MKLTKITDTLWLDVSTVVAIDTDAEPDRVVIYTSTSQHHVPLEQLATVLQALQVIEPDSDTFTAHGLTWRKHTPGDPMPCDGMKKVRLLTRMEVKDRSYYASSGLAYPCNWGRIPNNQDCEIIGWNYADTP